VKIALFDMDGVLLASHGYHRALQETVRLAACSLGFPDTTLSESDIAVFESVGVTSEWDEAAISTALLQLAAWRAEENGNQGIRPDFGAFALSLNREELEGLGPLERAVRAVQPLLDGLDKIRQEHILNLILNARQPQVSHTHRIFQELVLGSREYQRLYGLCAEFDQESYLLVHDISHLDGQRYTNLMDWFSQPGHSAAIMTSRPSLPPSGLFGTPEAELGAQLVGLSHLPLVGWGGISWLAAYYEVEPQSILKPDAVHALAAIQMALGTDMENALRQAFIFSRSPSGDPAAWRVLEGAEILVFEDSPVGLQSGKAAQAALARAGVMVTLGLYGISQFAVKKQALAAQGAQVHGTLAEALRSEGLA